MNRLNDNAEFVGFLSELIGDKMRVVHRYPATSEKRIPKPGIGNRIRMMWGTHMLNVAKLHPSVDTEYYKQLGVTFRAATPSREVIHDESDHAIYYIGEWFMEHCPQANYKSRIAKNHDPNHSRIPYSNKLLAPMPSDPMVAVVNFDVYDLEWARVQARIHELIVSLEFAYIGIDDTLYLSNRCYIERDDYGHYLELAHRR